MTEDLESSPPPAPAAKKVVKRKKSTKARASLPPHAPPKRLEAAEIAKARSSANAWDRRTRYSNKDFFVHPTFGVGLVTEALPEFIICLFEGGETRKLIHAR